MPPVLVSKKSGLACFSHVRHHQYRLFGRSHWLSTQRVARIRLELRVGCHSDGDCHPDHPSRSPTYLYQQQFMRPRLQAPRFLGVRLETNGIPRRNYRTASATALSVLSIGVLGATETSRLDRHYLHDDLWIIGHSASARRNGVPVFFAGECGKQRLPLHKMDKALGGLEFSEVQIRWKRQCRIRFFRSADRRKLRSMNYSNPKKLIGANDLDPQPAGCIAG